MSNKKFVLNMAWSLATSSTIEKAPAWEKRIDNGRFAFDMEATAGQVIGLGVLFEAKTITLPCGHPFKGMRLDLYLLGLHFGVCLTSSYKAHEAHHAELEQKPIDTHPLPFTEEQLRQADIEGLAELQEMADKLGAPIEQLVDGLPEPLRSEMLRRLGVNPDVPDVTATQVNAALEAIRMGRAGQ